VNPKFIELVDKAGFALWEDEDWRPRDAFVDWSSNYDKELEKFYELIVEECVNICVNGMTTQMTSGGAAMRIRQHFGPLQLDE
jgi:hypothetical protein